MASVCDDEATEVERDNWNVQRTIQVVKHNRSVGNGALHPLGPRKESSAEAIQLSTSEQAGRGFLQRRSLPTPYALIFFLLFFSPRLLLPLRLVSCKIPGLLFLCPSDLYPAAAWRAQGPCVRNSRRRRPLGIMRNFNLDNRVSITRRVRWFDTENHDLELQLPFEYWKPMVRSNYLLRFTFNKLADGRNADPIGREEISRSV